MGKSTLLSGTAQHYSDQVCDVMVLTCARGVVCECSVHVTSQKSNAERRTVCIGLSEMKDGSAESEDHELTFVLSQVNTVGRAAFPERAAIKNVDFSGACTDHQSTEHAHNSILNAHRKAEDASSHEIVEFGCWNHKQVAHLCSFVVDVSFVLVRTACTDCTIWPDRFRSSLNLLQFPQTRVSVRRPVLPALRAVPVVLPVLRAVPAVRSALRAVPVLLTVLRAVRAVL